MDLQLGDIILYKNTGILSHNLIQHYQEKQGIPKEFAEYTHVELSLGKTATINASFPKVSVNRDISGNNTYIKVVRPNIFDFDRYSHDLTMICANRIGTIYGLGIIWFILKDIFKRNIFSAIGDFCTELIGYGLKRKFVDELGYNYNHILPKKYDEMYPADFLYHKDYFRVIWQGYI